MIDERVCAVASGPVWLIVGSRDARLRPSADYAYGVRIEDDRHVTLVVPSVRGEALRERLDDSERLAVAFNALDAVVCYPLKGRVIDIREAGPLEHGLSDIHMARIATLRKGTEHISDLPMRVGINPGTITAGILGPNDKSLYDVLGDAVNVASRVEKISPAGGVVIAPDTHALIAPSFALEPLGEQAVEGKGAIACWRVVGLRPLLSDPRRVDEGSVFASSYSAVVAEVEACAREDLAAVDFASIQARDGALGHNQAVAAIAVALLRFLRTEKQGAGRSLDAVTDDDVMYLSLLHDLGKHAIEPSRPNAGLLTSAQREKLVHDLHASTADALERLGLRKLQGPLDRLYRFEASRGAQPESDPLVLIVAAADMYDALTAPKLYKGKPWSITGTLDELLRTPHATREPCSIFQGLAELMRPPSTTVSSRAKQDVLFR